MIQNKSLKITSCSTNNLTHSCNSSPKGTFKFHVAFTLLYNYQIAIIGGPFQTIRSHFHPFSSFVHITLKIAFTIPSAPIRFSERFLKCGVQQVINRSDVATVPDEPERKKIYKILLRIDLKEDNRVCATLSFFRFEMSIKYMHSISI